MSTQRSTHNLGTAATGNDQLKQAEPPRTLQSFGVVKDLDSSRFADVRLKSEETTPMLSEQMRRSTNREVPPDLRSYCPICGSLYQSGEEVAVLACLAFATSAVPAAPAAAGCDPSSKMILGHHACVLPRLLTLLAGFQPDARFVRALKNYSTDASVSPEGYHDGP